MNDQFTITPAPVATVARPAGRAQLARVGLLGIAAAALIAAAMLIFGAGASPAGTLAAGTEGGTSGLSGIGENLNGFRGGPGGPGFGHRPGRGITVTAISGSDLSLATVDGWTRTIRVDDGTTFSESGDEISLADIAVGDEIAFRQTREDDGSWTIDAIAVILPHLGGEVTAVDGSTITITQRDDTTATINVDGSTEYIVHGDVGTLADVEVGMLLVAEGTENADGSINAMDVRAAERGVFRGPGGKGFGFGHGPGGDPDDVDPDATQVPATTDSAS